MLSGRTILQENIINRAIKKLSNMCSGQFDLILDSLPDTDKEILEIGEHRVICDIVDDTLNQ